MAIAQPVPEPALLIYEAYMAEGEVNLRYDIVEGVRIFMPAPTWEHQVIQGNSYDALRDYEKATGNGKALMAPFDVLIRRKPRLQTRQPDVLFISYERLTQGSGPPKKDPLAVAPELVVEIISDTERRQMIADKIKDYCEIGVLECWRVWPETRIVEVLRLTKKGAEVAAAYDETETIQSITFPDLTVSVASLFAG